ncbi:PHD finger protein [Cardamine amara subsp. amara]|uniref:PHD finger protein n=1 Tax=Cardamine amara subsp. amara TaxID=228776 RepID=A0ABD0ZV18_CARAN
MDITASNLPMNLESVPATSMVDDNGDEPMAPPAKKQRFGEDMSRVAEIVLVLSALGRMRGGQAPTELENELMVEARSKLAVICQEFSPKDLIGSDDVKAVIEDLGLNGKLNKDQRLGFRAPKLTISEKLSLGKRKMEEAKMYPTPTVSTGFVSHLSQPNGSVASPGLAKNIFVTHQWPSSEVTTVKTTGSNFRMDRPQMMINGASQGTPVSSANYYSASWSAQPQSTISFSTASDKKVPIQSSVKVADPSFRPFMSQTPHHTFTGTNQPMHYGQTSLSGNNHSEIAKIIQKVLQPGFKQYPLWNPPSREYMSRAMACEMCKVTINEVDSLLICDACEKAFHLICLQANNVQGVPKSEWHCSRCVQAGKPFPPQYGRAITTNRTKMPSRSAGVQSSTAKKVGSMDMKVNQQKPIVPTNPGAQKFLGFVSGAATASHFESASVNANTTASAAKTTNIGPQGFRESVICGTNSPATTSTSAVINNGLVSKSLTPVGTVSSTSPLSFSNQDTMAATSNATPSTAITASLVAQAPTTVTENGDISSTSTASGTADHSISNTDLNTQVHTLTVTSSSNSQTVVLHSGNAKATEDAAIGQALNADDGPQALVENIARCENPSESTSHSDSLDDKTTSANGQESSKDDTEKFAPETCQNHPPTESPAAVLSDEDSKITAQPSMPLENSGYQTEKTLSQPLLVVSNYHSQTEKETPNVQDSLQNVPEDSQGKGLNG